VPRLLSLKNMQNESSKSNSAFETLIKASPSDLTTSPEAYLDAIYGENRAVIMESPTSNGGLSLRRFGQGVPDTGDVLQCVSIPVDTSKLGESKLTPDTVFKHLTWSHAVALFRPGQDLSLLLQAIATGTLPVVAALSVGTGTTGLQLLLRINAASKGAWQQECNKIWKQFAALKANAMPPMWLFPSVLPKKAGGVELVYLNPNRQG
jgi:hypothetical protein